MEFSQELSYILIGGLVGVTSSLVGGVVDYLLARQRRSVNDDASGLPGCIFIVTGGLGVVGLVVTAASFLLTGGIRIALLAGAGVFAGFIVTFILLSVIWIIFLDDEKQPSEQPQTQPSESPPEKSGREPDQQIAR